VSIRPRVSSQWFHSTALCSPTRAALITGRNHHSVGFGVIGELSTGYPGYDSIIGPESATISPLLWGTGRLCTLIAVLGQGDPGERWDTVSDRRAYHKLGVAKA
jgi:hypothetical protein